MKRVLFSILLGLFATMGYAQDIMGKWVTEAGDAQVEIFEHNGKVNGKIVWLQKGPDTKDVHNKDYKCSIWMEGNKLKVRGYIGFLYETQTWTRK